MKNNNELLAGLHMVLVRLDGLVSGTSAEWRVIEAHLHDAAKYAGKCARLRERLAARKVAEPALPSAAEEDGQRLAEGLEDADFDQGIEL
jgi:hypothetical protein